MIQELKRNQRDFENQVRLFAEHGDDGRLERLGSMRDRQETLMQHLRENLPIGMDFKKAKEIMKDSFYGVEETKRQLDWAAGFNEKDMGPIPFSPRELREAQESGQYLIHRFSKDVFGDEVTPSFIRSQAPDRLQTKEMLEGVFTYIESGSGQDEVYESGWRIGDLRPLIKGMNYFDALSKVAKQVGELGAFVNVVTDLKNKLQINLRNKSVSDRELMKLAERGLGHLGSYRHSVEEFYYDAIVTGLLPEIIHSHASSRYVTSTKTSTGFVEIDVSLKEDRTMSAQIVFFRLADWSQTEDSMSFQRSE